MTLARPAVPAGLIRQRCDPYGRESRIQLMGGLYPEKRASATALEMGFCPRLAEGVYRMVCACGHRGQPMPLCGPGLVQDSRGQWYPHPGHVASIQRRQAGLCPPCAFPPAARELAEAMEARQADVYHAQAAGLPVAAAKLAAALEQLQEQMNELVARGAVHKCPLHLVEVSLWQPPPRSGPASRRPVLTCPIRAAFRERTWPFMRAWPRTAPGPR